MKRCRIGVGLLVLFLVLGLICACFLARFGEEAARDAELAAALADTDRPRAEEILNQLRYRWQKRQFLLHILSDHEPLREADTLFLLLRHPSEADSFRENALRLARIFRNLSQSQLPTWENIL
jgi:hypothetical protein